MTIFFNLLFLYLLTVLYIVSLYKNIKENPFIILGKDCTLIWPIVVIVYVAGFIKGYCITIINIFRRE